MWADEIDKQLLPLNWKTDSNETTPSTDNHNQITVEQNAEDLDVASSNADKLNGLSNTNNILDNSNTNEMNNDNSNANNFEKMNEKPEYETYTAKENIQSVHFSFSDVGNFAFQKTADKNEFLNKVAAQPSNTINLDTNSDDKISSMDRVTFNFVSNDDNHEMIREKNDVIEEHEWNIKDDVFNNKDLSDEHNNENDYTSQVTNIESRPNYLDENGNVVTSEWLKEIELRRTLSADQESVYHASADKLQPRVGQSDILGKFTFISINLAKFSEYFKELRKLYLKSYTYYILFCLNYLVIVT